MKFEVKPIGIIHTPYETSIDVPIQPAFSETEGRAEIFPEFVSGLDSLEGFSHLILLSWFHKAKDPKMKVVPYMDSVERGLFATRAPARPNPIGFSIVELLQIESNTIFFKGADMLDGTPLLDIKPYVSKFDSPTSTKMGWLEEAMSKRKDKQVADSRFEK